MPDVKPQQMERGLDLMNGHLYGLGSAVVVIRTFSGNGKKVLFLLRPMSIALAFMTLQLIPTVIQDIISCGAQ
jgi:hypothetical protein